MPFPQLLIYLLAPLAAYLLGSIPFAFVIGKSHGIDIRTTGSGNIGATNLGRTLGKKYFWQAFALDAAKGFLPVLLVSLLVRHLNAPIPLLDGEWSATLGGVIRGGFTAPPAITFPAWSPLLTAAACMLGHIFPIYLKFKGGKGVATGFGVVLGFWPLFTLAGLGAALIFVIMLAIYRYISLASISGALAFFLLVIALGQWQHQGNFAYLPWPQLSPLVLMAAAFSALIIFRHRANLGRLLKGTEPQVGQREIDRAQMPAPPKNKT